MGEVLGKELVYPSHLSAGVRLGRDQEFPLEVAHQTLGRPKQPGNLGRLVSLLGLEGSWLFRRFQLRLNKKLKPTIIFIFILLVIRIKNGLPFSVRCIFVITFLIRFMIAGLQGGKLNWGFFFTCMFSNAHAGAHPPLRDPFVPLNF